MNNLSCPLNNKHKYCGKLPCLLCPFVINPSRREKYVYPK